MSRARTTAVMEYDAVIVGAGTAGAILALELGRAGKRVLILESGRGTAGNEEGWRSAVETFYTAVAKVPNSPYPPTTGAPQPDVLQNRQIEAGRPSTAGYFVQHGPHPFSSDYTRAKGGTTMHWQATTLRMLPADFKMQDHYGVGANWPLSYEDLRPYYERAEFEIGVAGDTADQRLPGVDPKQFWGDYQFPMQQIPTSYVAKRLAARVGRLKVPLGGREYKVDVISTPEGRNGMPNPNYVNPHTGARGFQPTGTPGDPLRGERCQGNSSCTPICPVQAKYSALRTLSRAQALDAPAEPKVQIRNQAVASRIVIDPETGRVTGIEYQVYDDSGAPPTTLLAKARVYAVAAHAVETAKLMLISELGGRSGQLGRNLMDHPTMLTWGLMPEPVWPFRGPGSTNHIPTFRDGPFRAEHSAFIVPIDNWGWGWSAFSPGSDVAGLVGQGLLGRPLRQRLADELSRQVSLQWEFEQLGETGNQVTIDRTYPDTLGLPRPVIHYRLSEYVLKAMEAALAINQRLFRAAGIDDRTTFSPSAPGYVTYRGQGYQYVGCGHLVGTHRMGARPSESVTDSWMRCWEHANLYLVGCGSMPTFGTSNPTLTMSALAFRAADAMLQDLNGPAAP